MGTTYQVRLLVAGRRLPETRALHQLLAQQPSISVVGETNDVSRVPQLVTLWNPDLVLLLARELGVALEAIRTVLAHVPETKLLVVTDSFTPDEAAKVLEHGARGILPGSAADAHGVRAILAVQAGEIWGSRALLSRIVLASIRQAAAMRARSDSSHNLTEREREIVDLLQGGSSNKEIASHLSISDKTVKTHLHNIFGKLRIHRRQKVVPALRT